MAIKVIAQRREVKLLYGQVSGLYYHKQDNLSKGRMVHL